MSMHGEITYPKEYQTKFPRDFCIVCLEKPNSIVSILEIQSNFWIQAFLPYFSIFSLSRYRIPICDACASRFQFQRRFRNFNRWVLGISFLTLFIPTILGNENTVLGLVLCLVLQGLYGLYTYRNRKYFEAYDKQQETVYKMSSFAYAMVFAAENVSGAEADLLMKA